MTGCEARSRGLGRKKPFFFFLPPLPPSLTSENPFARVTMTHIKLRVVDKVFIFIEDEAGLHCTPAPIRINVGEGSY